MRKVSHKSIGAPKSDVIRERRERYVKRAKEVATQMATQ